MPQGKKTACDRQLDLFADLVAGAKPCYPEDLDQAKTLMRDTALSAFKKALEHYKLRSANLPEIDFSLRGRCAGGASWTWRKMAIGKEITGMKLRFSLEAYQLDPADMLEDTIYHEVAHLVVALKYRNKRSPHGPEWQKVMRECFGIEPRRTHNLKLTPARRVERGFVYACQCREHHLTSIRHNRIIKRNRRYRCYSCGEALVFKSE